MPPCWDRSSSRSPPTSPTYFDHAKGSDRPDRKGPARAVASGWITPRAMGAATALMFALAFAMMILLVLRAGWPLLVIGLVSVVCGVWYTAGRYALAYLGLGDLFVVVFFGPVAVGGTYYAQVLPSSLDSWWPVLVAGLGPGLIANGLLVVNNLRDIDEDRVSRKRTLAVRFGATFSRWEYVACLLLGCAAPTAAFLLRPDLLPSGICASSAAVLAAVPAFRGILSGTRGASLNAFLGCTGRTWSSSPCSSRWGRCSGQAAAAARVWTCLLPLREPLRVKDRTLRMREGVLVWTRDADGVGAASARPPPAGLQHRHPGAGAAARCCATCALRAPTAGGCPCPPFIARSTCWAPPRPALFPSPSTDSPRATPNPPPRRRSPG
ncbi:MAG: 1,4-dihydroxy-2-naphthoate octaprenyltransferase [Kiritimatiellia bacterium]